MVCGPYGTPCVAFGSDAGLTVVVETGSVALLLVAVPQTLVKTAWYCLRLSAAVATKVSVVLVAPGMSLNGPPVETCHCTEAEGVDAAVKITDEPAQMICESGW